MVELGFLAFLAEPWFVIPWYVTALGGVIWIVHDMYTTTRMSTTL